MYKGLYYIYTVAKNTVEQKKKVVFQMINHTIFLLFSLYLYKYVYELLPSMHSKLPFPNAIWSMAVYFMIFWLGLRNIERSFRDDIRSGNIEMYLLRPMGYIWQKVLIKIGEGIIPFLSATMLSITVCYLFVGLPIVNVSLGYWFLGLLLILTFSQILTVLIYVLCGLTGFWLDNSQPVFFIVSKFIMVFGGAWVPVAFFPKILQNIAEFSPFGASMSMSFAMYPDFGTHFPIIILNILFWSIVCLLLVQIVSRRAFKKLAVNG